MSLNGDVDVQSIFAASLPATHPSFAPQRNLEMSEKWIAPPIPHEPVELFIGILSAGNHFAERMAVRKSWMQSKLIKSSRVVARFFVALVGSNLRSSLLLAQFLLVLFVHSFQIMFILLILYPMQHGRKEVNVELKKEAEFFGDIIIVPFMDSYDLVVLKTVAICEYGVSGLRCEVLFRVNSAEASILAEVHTLLMPISIIFVCRCVLYRLSTS